MLETLKAKLTQAEEQTKFVRDKRNKELAHLDLESVKASTSLPAGSRQQVSRILELFQEIMNIVSRHYRNCETSFKGILIIDGAANLVTTIEDGLAYNILREKCIEERDWNNPILKDTFGRHR